MMTPPCLAVRIVTIIDKKDMDDMSVNCDHHISKSLTSWMEAYVKFGLDEFSLHSQFLGSMVSMITTTSTFGNLATRATFRFTWHRFYYLYHRLQHVIRRNCFNLTSSSFILAWLSCFSSQFAQFHNLTTCTSGSSFVSPPLGFGQIQTRKPSVLFAPNPALIELRSISTSSLLLLSSLSSSSSSSSAVTASAAPVAG